MTRVKRQAIHSTKHKLQLKVPLLHHYGAIPAGKIKAATLAEVQVLASLSHPNIVKFHDAFMDDYYINIGVNEKHFASSCSSLQSSTGSLAGSQHTSTVNSNQRCAVLQLAVRVMMDHAACASSSASPDTVLNLSYSKKQFQAWLNTVWHHARVEGELQISAAAGVVISMIVYAGIGCASTNIVLFRLPSSCALL